MFDSGHQRLGIAGREELMKGLIDQIEFHHAPHATPEDKSDDGKQFAAPQPDAPGPALDFNPYELEPAWRDYPCEWKRPRFGHVPHEVDWQKLYELRRQGRNADTLTKPGDDSTTAPVTGAK